MKLDKWSLWCETCAATRYTDYQPKQDGEPTHCPYNEEHTDIRDITLIDETSTDPLPVQEIDVATLDPTYARSKSKGVNFDAAQGAWTKEDVVFPYVVNILNGEGYAGFSEDGDKCEFRVSPQLVGGVTVPASQNDTQVYVSDTVKDAFLSKQIFPGMFMKFKRDGIPGYPDNPNPGDDEYEIAAFTPSETPNASVVTLRTGLASDVPAASLVYITAKYGDTIELQKDECVNVGGVAAGSAAVDANIIFEIWYYAVSAKRVRLRLNLKYGPVIEE